MVFTIKNVLISDQELAMLCIYDIVTGGLQTLPPIIFDIQNVTVQRVFISGKGGIIILKNFRYKPLKITFSQVVITDITALEGALI